MPARNRVLAVDDNPINLAVIEEALQGHFQLRLAQDGNEVYRIAPTFMPDVVLLDVMMPGPDGYELCSWMKNDPLLRQSQVIMVSARTNVDDRLRGYRAGADDYVTKPFNEQELCAKVDVALKTRDLMSTIQDQVDVLCDATGQVLELVAHLRDAETGEHLDRMRIYSHLLAAELRDDPIACQIDDAFLDDLYRASPLHDIGKIAIPDAILQKPGPLTKEEREEMQRHTIIGESILNHLVELQPEVSFFRLAAEIARWHHESFDGSGFPDGLQGTAIPLAARIVKVADVFDALTSARVYKSPCDPSAARDQMTGVEAASFDPAILDAMLRVFDEFTEVCHSPHSFEISPLFSTPSYAH